MKDAYSMGGIPFKGGKDFTGFQFDVQQKIKSILAEHHFRASDSSVYHLHLKVVLQNLILGNFVVSATIMKFDHARKCKKREQITKVVSKTWLFHVFAALLTNLRFML